MGVTEVDQRIMQAVTIVSELGHTTLRCEQWVSKPLDEVFTFFADAHNLERITPPFLRFSVRSMTTPAIQQGTKITYRLRLHGLPISWTSRVEEWEPPNGFTDVQIRGPFRLWRHRHEFIAERQGTRVRDTVHYRVPCARLLHILRLPWVDRDLEQIFRYRQQIIANLFGGKKPHPPSHSC